MSQPSKTYDSTVALIAGKLLSNAPWHVIEDGWNRIAMARSAVMMARLIIQATVDSEPPPEEQP